MEELHKCLECGADLAANISDGHCTVCLLQLGIALPDTETALQVGDRIGRYRLLEKVGEGGCGVVFRAEQEEPLRRQVALKVIKSGMDTNRVIARFEAERQMLASLDHPHIAKIFDADATDTGRPFFVMELVRGIKITRYCDEHKLSIRERLELFTLVCLAVQHAHQKGIIHRDLKPSNILVVEGEHGAKAMPKIIDFGIAKTIDRRWTEQEKFPQFLGTSVYMSPEQAGRGGAEVDTRSDIYSLGVLLYELLAGVAPFDPAELRQYPAQEVARFIREKEPLWPSTRLASLPWPQLAVVAQRRGLETAALPRLLRDDLDWIAMKCLEKESSRRYETAFGLARDLQRYLADEPVVARPSSRWYRLEKTMRRNKLAFTAVVSVMAAFLVGTGFAIWSYANEKEAQRRVLIAEKLQLQSIERAENAQKLAMQQERKSMEVAAILRKMVADAGGSPSSRESGKLLGLLDHSVTNAIRDLKNQPGAQLETLIMCTESYRQLNVWLSMEKTARAAVQIAQGIDDDLATSRTLGQLGFALLRQRKFHEAEIETRASLALKEKLLGHDTPQAARTLHVLSEILLAEGRLTEAEAADRDVLAIIQKRLPPNSPPFIVVYDNLSHILAAQNRPAEAVAMSGQADAIRRLNERKEIPETIDSTEKVRFKLGNGD